MPTTPQRLNSEGLVTKLWREGGAHLPALECDDGTRLRVLYPGRPSADAGPDFRDAMLVTAEGRLLFGDVEVHLRPEGWRAHGHHRDRRYNGVVLHVVLWPSTGASGGSPSALEMGTQIPTATLSPVLSRHIGPTAHRPISRRRAQELALRPPLPPLVPRGRPGQALDRAGDARFTEKSRAFLQLLSPRDGRGPASGAAQAGEVLYLGVMDALGYSRNREPFRKLARGMPLARLDRMVRDLNPEERKTALQALLLGAAGLLASPGGGDEKRRHVAGSTLTASLLPLQGRWRNTGLAPVVEAEEWRLFRIRPSNHPARRLIGMARLLDCLWDEGLVEGLARNVKSGTVEGLRAALIQPSPDVQADQGAGLMGTALIGGDRAGEIAVNMALPFFFAWGSLVRDGHLRRTALALYRAWPTLPSNEISREMAALLTSQMGAQAATRGNDVLRREITGARRQQGLIHLYRRWVNISA